MYSSSNSITANMLKLSDDLLIFIFILHPADEEKLLLKIAHHYSRWLHIKELLHCHEHLPDNKSFFFN